MPTIFTERAAALTVPSALFPAVGGLPGADQPQAYRGVQGRAELDRVGRDRRGRLLPGSAAADPVRLARVRGGLHAVRAGQRLVRSPPEPQVRRGGDPPPGGAAAPLLPAAAARRPAALRDAGADAGGDRGAAGGRWHRAAGDAPEAGLPAGA